MTELMTIIEPVDNLNVAVVLDNALPVEFTFEFKDDVAHLTVHSLDYVPLAKLYAFLMREQLGSETGQSPHWFHVIGDEPSSASTVALAALMRAIPGPAICDALAEGGSAVDDLAHTFGVSELALKARLCVFDQLVGAAI